MSAKRTKRTGRRTRAPKAKRALAPAPRRTRQRRPGAPASDSAVAGDVPYTMRLPDGRTLFVVVPGKWCEADVSGEVAFKPEAVRLLDRVRVLAMRAPRVPTPGFIRTLREALGLTQKQLGQRIGVDGLSVSRWERGAVKPSAPAVGALERLRQEAGREGVVIANGT